MVRRSERILLAALSAIAVSLSALVAHTDAVARSCVTVPTTINPAALALDRRKIWARVGATIYVALIEPAKYTGPQYPRVFPWRAPRSSNPRVLAAVPVCERMSVTTLASMYTVFRVLAPGTASLNAPLAARWRTRRSGLHPYRSTLAAFPASAVLCPSSPPPGQLPFDTRTLVGLTEKQAAARASSYHCIIRVVKRDHLNLPAQTDLLLARINVDIEGGRVTQILGIY